MLCFVALACFTGLVYWNLDLGADGTRNRVNALFLHTQFLLLMVRWGGSGCRGAFFRADGTETASSEQPVAYLPACLRARLPACVPAAPKASSAPCSRPPTPRKPQPVNAPHQPPAVCLS